MYLTQLTLPFPISAAERLAAFKSQLIALTRTKAVSATLLTFLILGTFFIFGEGINFAWQLAAWAIAAVSGLLIYLTNRTGMYDWIWKHFEEKEAAV